MTYPILELTDGITSISLISRDEGLFLNDWNPQIAGIKGDGVWRDSSVLDGRSLSFYRHNNVQETFDLKVSSDDQDRVIFILQELRRMLEKARTYWVTNYSTQPVYLVARGPNETNVRYALIHDWRTPDDANPFVMPFFNCNPVAVDAFTLILERSHWMAYPPGDGHCIQTSTSQASQPFIGSIDKIVSGTSPNDTKIDVTNSTLKVTATKCELGLSGGAAIGCGARFDSVEIPPGATILSAFLRVQCAQTTFAIQMRTVIRGEDADNSAQFSTWADYAARPITTANVQWNHLTNTAWDEGDFFDTTNIASIVTEIYSRAGWVSGNAMTFFILDNGSGGCNYIYQSDNLHMGFAPVLHITYKVGVGVYDIASAICDQPAYTANKHNLAQISHVAVQDSPAAIGVNLIGTTLPYQLLPAAPAANDALYIGIASTSDNYGPFSNVLFNLRPATAGITGTWQYWNGAWTALPNIYYDEGDVNNHFYYDRKRLVSWDVPTDWVPVNQTIGGVVTMAYWVRFLVAVGTSIGPYQLDTDPYSILSPYVNIDSSQVTGDLPALVRMVMTSMTGTFPQRIIAGMRTLSRGDDFTPYINISDEQNHPGVAILSGIGAFADTPYSSTGRCARGATVTGANPCARVTLNSHLSDQYKGTYHVYLRARQTTGSGGDVSLAIRTVEGAYGGYVTNEYVPFTNVNQTEVLDMGILSFRQLLPDEVTSSTVIYIWADVAGTTIELYDLILMPVDEMVFMLTSTLLNVNHYSFTVSSLDDFRLPNRAVVTDSSNQFLTHPQIIANQRLQLRPNISQRIWFFAMTYDATDLCWLSNPWTVTSQYVYANPQYFSMRGER